jgi:hypothetical protein
MTEPRLTGDPAEASSPAHAPARWQRPELVIWGAHGGAATTTLANWLPPAWDMGAMPPEPDPSYPATITRGRPLVVACRNTAWSALQATRAVNLVNQQGGHVGVLAVVSDSWPEPAAARQRFRLLESHVGAVVRVPFVFGLRLADDPGQVPPPRRARRAITQIRAAATRSVLAPGHQGGC